MEIYKQFVLNDTISNFGYRQNTGNKFYKCASLGKQVIESS